MYSGYFQYNLNFLGLLKRSSVHRPKAKKFNFNTFLEKSIFVIASCHCCKKLSTCFKKESFLHSSYVKNG